MVDETRTCRMCGEPKPLTRFPKDRLRTSKAHKSRDGKNHGAWTGIEKDYRCYDCRPFDKSRFHKGDPEKEREWTARRNKAVNKAMMELRRNHVEEFGRLYEKWRHVFDEVEVVGTVTVSQHEKIVFAKPLIQVTDG